MQKKKRIYLNKGVAIANNLLSKFEDYANEYFKQGEYELGSYLTWN